MFCCRLPPESIQRLFILCVKFTKVIQKLKQGLHLLSSRIQFTAFQKISLILPVRSRRFCKECVGHMINTDRQGEIWTSVCALNRLWHWWPATSGIYIIKLLRRIKFNEQNTICLNFVVLPPTIKCCVMTTVDLRCLAALKSPRVHLWGLLIEKLKSDSPSAQPKLCCPTPLFTINLVLLLFCLLAQNTTV